ncbi:MAG: DUF3267 domain-containing protein [Mariniphaga sp.]|nr:DUF3267 domain-containing protein [Mariniphaga sp.]
MTTNPSITELNNEIDYELLAELKHTSVKEFVLNQIKGGSRIIRFYLIYQFVMISLGMLFIGLSVVNAFDGNSINLYYTMAALISCFSVLIVIHELIHGLAFKSVGTPRVTYGAILKQFVFYAEADKFVLNRKQFTIVAMAPLIIIKLISIIVILIFLFHPVAWFFVVFMSIHSLFCAGDVALLSFFYKYPEEVFTYDLKSEKVSYYYRRKPSE